MLEPPAEGVLFAGGDGHVQRIADLLEARQVVVRNGLLEVIYAELFELAPLLNGGGKPNSRCWRRIPDTRRPIGIRGRA